MSEAKVDLTVQDGGAVSAWKRYQAALEAVLTVDRQRTAEDKKASQAATELGRIKSRVLGEIETATDRYSKRLDELQRLDHAGMISAQEFARAHKQAKAELDAANPVLAEAAQRQRELARAAQQTIQAVQTPFEGYRQRVVALKNQLAAGVITQENYNRALRLSREELVKGSGKLDERKRKEQELASLQRQVLESITTPQERYNRQLSTLSMLRQRNKLDEDQYARAVTHAKTQLTASTEAGKEHLASATLGIAKFAGAALGVGSALGAVGLAAQLLKREWENLKESQKSAADRQVDLVAARDEAIMNIGADPELAGGKADALIEQASTKTGATRRSLWKAFSGAASFKGDLSNKAAMQAVEQAARLTPTDDAAIQKNTIAQLQLMQEDRGVTPEMALGFILKAKEASPTITNESFSAYAVPSIRQGQKFGMTAREAAALNATIGSSIGDEEGRVTATATTQLSKQLAELMPNVQGGTIGRLAALQTPEFASARRTLLGAFDREHKSKKGAKLEGEAKAFMAMIELIQGGDSKTSQSLQATLQRMPEIHASGGHFENVVGALNANPMRQNMLLRNTLAAGTEGLQLGNIVGARGAIAREGLGELLKAAGVSKIGQDVAGFAFEAATMGGREAPVQALQQQLRDRARAMSFDEVVSSGGLAYGEGSFSDGTELVPTRNPEKLRTSGDLSRIADSLQVLVDLQKAENKEVAEQGKTIKEGNRSRPNNLPTGRRAAEGLATKP